MSKQYQPETTHVDPNSTIVSEYMYSKGVWYYFSSDSDEWVASRNHLKWHDESLIPIGSLAIGEHVHDAQACKEESAAPEQDPNGIDQHDNGAKLDAGKPMAGRLLGMFGGALMAVSEVGTFGAKKYTEGGWQHVEDGFKRYDDAGMRHFLKRGMGEEFDADSELPHLAHEAWNALAKLELYLRDKKGE